MNNIIGAKSSDKELNGELKKHQLALISIYKNHASVQASRRFVSTWPPDEQEASDQGEIDLQAVIRRTASLSLAHLRKKLFN